MGWVYIKCDLHCMDAGTGILSKPALRDIHYGSGIKELYWFGSYQGDCWRL